MPSVSKTPSNIASGLAITKWLDWNCEDQYRLYDLKKSGLNRKIQQIKLIIFFGNILNIIFQAHGFLLLF